MRLRSGFHAALRALPLLLPLALLPLARRGLLPPGLAFVVVNGVWLIVLAAAAAAAVLFQRGAGFSSPSLWTWASNRVEEWPTRPLTLALALAAFVAALLLVPAYRWYGPPSGDEPKYLRLAFSLYRDLDADVAANQPGRLELGGLARNITHLCERTVRTLLALAGGDRPSADRAWSQRNWTIAGWGGGLYYVQSPGLPALLAPALGLDPPLEPEGPPPPLAVVTLAALWAFALVQTAKLAAETSGSRWAGLWAAIAVATSAPLLVGGQHFYPETAAAAAVPWLARWLRVGAPRPGLARTLVLGLIAGGLAWLHVKLLPLGLTAASLLALRLRPRDRAWLLAAVALPLTGLLLFQYAVTGLLRPDAIYLRFGSDVYRGPGDFLSARLLGGLANALFGPRDGSFVMAPVLLAAALALPRLWQRDRATTLALGALFASLWVVVALHGGGAPGPPARLLAPVLPLLAVPLALGLVELGDHLPFRWAVVGLLLASWTLSAAMLQDWRRTVKPFRGVLTPATDFTADLPGGTASGAATVAGGGVLLLVGAFWARRLSASAPQPQSSATVVWRQVLTLHLGAWATVAAVAAALHGLRLLLGPP